MSQINWNAFNTDDADATHERVASQLAGLMETGHHGKARELLDTYAVDFPTLAEALRLSLVRKYGTGL